jgi:hypothetical protein
MISSASTKYALEVYDRSNDMAECTFRQHQWDPRAQDRPGYERIEFTCKICGVGHRLEITTLPRGARRVDITIFPATGETGVSRDVIRWSMLACEGTIQQMQQEGVAVVRGDTMIEGEPRGV